jgi:hypothetical protein
MWERQDDGTPQCGPAMHEVQILLKGWKLADALGELRKWLDHHHCTPEQFDIARAKRGALLVRIHFTEHDIAEAFQRDFGG